MPSTVTTVTVHPERADALRDRRDEEDLPNLDAALESLIDEAGGSDTLTPEA